MMAQASEWGEQRQCGLMHGYKVQLKFPFMQAMVCQQHILSFFLANKPSCQTRFHWFAGDSFEQQSLLSMLTAPDQVSFCANRCSRVLLTGLQCFMQTVVHALCCASHFNGLGPYEGTARTLSRQLKVCC